MLTVCCLSVDRHSPRVPYQEQVAQELPSHGRDSETPQLAYGSQVPSATDYLKAEGKQVQSDAVQTENIESRSSTAQLKSLLPQRLAQVCPTSIDNTLLTCSLLE